MSMDNYASSPFSPTNNPHNAWRRPFGAMIQDAREHAARSVSEVAQLAGMESSVWAAIEGGGILVDPAWIRPMADALGISVDEIETMIHFSQFLC